MKRPGYYVENRYFRDSFHQARARAAFLAQEYGRPIQVLFVGHDDPIPTLVCEIHNDKKKTA